VLQKIDLVVSNTISGLIVEHAVSSNAGSARSSDGCSCVEACMRSIFHIWPVAKPLVFQEVVDYMDFTGVLVVLVRTFVSFWNIDSMFTDR
jgi:hypothetical protein